LQRFGKFAFPSTDEKLRRILLTPARYLELFSKA